MGVAARDLGDGDAGAARVRSSNDRFGNGNAGIGEGGSADQAQSFVAHQQPATNFEPVADAFERAPLTLFSTLTVTDVDGSCLVVACRERRTYAGIHAAA